MCVLIGESASLEARGGVVGVESSGGSAVGGKGSSTVSTGRKLSASLLRGEIRCFGR